eukprot:scaffold7174_cov143-Amphora_coffeaeformis.AAC.4
MHPSLSPAAFAFVWPRLVLYAAVQRIGEEILRQIPPADGNPYPAAAKNVNKDATDTVGATDDTEDPYYHSVASWAAKIDGLSSKIETAKCIVGDGMKVSNTITFRANPNAATTKERYSTN